MSPNEKLLRHQGGEPALRMLIACAKRRGTITYENLGFFVAHELRRKNDWIWRHMGHVAGALMDRIWEQDSPLLPPINLLVVNKNTHLPSYGANGHIDVFMRATGRAQTLSGRDRDQLVKALMSEVRAYKKWRSVYRKVYGQKYIEPAKWAKYVDLEIQEPNKRKKQGKRRRRGGFGGPAEGPEHRALKKAVLDNPRRAIGHTDVRYKQPEMPLKSRDKVDAYFDCEKEIVCVEVKPSIASEHELECGIYQCVKYRAVIQAEEEIESQLGAQRGVRAKLVYCGTLMPLKLHRIAEQLDVEVLRWSENEFGGG